MISYAELMSVLDKSGKSFAAQQNDSDTDDESLSIETLLSATEKLLAVSKGQAEPDERDSLEFRRVMTPDKLFAERIDLDADRLLRNLGRMVSKTKSLKPLSSSYFSPYTEGLIVGHPMSSPLEEINPLQLVEQARRVTAMGPGGLSSDDQITPESQNVHPSIFGFLSVLEGPESSRAGVDTRLSWGAAIGDDGKIYNTFNNRHTGKDELVSASELAGSTVGLPD